MRIRYVQPSENSFLNILSFGYSENPDKTRWGKGSRNVCIIHYVIEGYGYFNGITVRKNQGFVIHPNQSVEYKGNADSPWKYFWIIFDGSECETICKKHIDAEDGIFDYSFRSQIISLSRSTFSSVTPMYQSAALSLFFHLLSLHDSQEITRTNSYVEQAKSYMNLHFHRNVSVFEVATSMNISDRYLYNLFVKQEGVSPKQYLTALRLSNAKRLLRETGHSISEIAVSVGFPDVLSFSRFFARHTGSSPTAFRRSETG
jgi:AraC family transcriptional regulator of arabinose operon